jgi:hypothetical protein
VNDVLFLIQFGAAATLIVAPAILINRLLARAEGGTLADLFAIPLDPPWPRGVQEEEPARWRMEMLSQAASPAGRAPDARPALRPADTARPRRTTQPTQFGTETGRCA